MEKSRGKRIQAAPHDIENPNPNSNMQLGDWMKELNLDIPSPMSPSRCIFRVPHRLRCEREKDVHYTPQVISIGPLHHENPALKAMEVHKKRYLQYFLSRPNNLSRMNEYKETIKGKEAELRSCYSETIDQYGSDEFVKIILVDAIFIIEFLFRNCYPELLNENDCIFGKPRLVEDVWPDLLMLENQLPFFILVDLFDPTIFLVPSKYSQDKPGGVELSILSLSHCFLNCVPTFGGLSNDLETILSFEVEHFVDLLRKLCMPLMLEEQFKRTIEGATTSLDSHQFSDSNCTNLEVGAVAPLDKKTKYVGQSKCTTAPNIEKLDLAGVKIEGRPTRNLFDIQFKSPILQIPKLKIEDRTEVILRNLIAFEQCNTFEICYISDYVLIMDSFVDTPKDVELLVGYGIIENLLGGGNNKLFTMIKSLSTGVVCSLNFGYTYRTLCGSLNNFCMGMWNKHRANLKREYLNNPREFINFVYGLGFILVLTLIQTICSVISLNH